MNILRLCTLNYFTSHFFFSSPKILYFSESFYSILNSKKHLKIYEYIKCKTNVKFKFYYFFYRDKILPTLCSSTCCTCLITALYIHCKKDKISLINENLIQSEMKIYYNKSELATISKKRSLTF